MLFHVFIRCNKHKLTLNTLIQDHLPCSSLLTHIGHECDSNIIVIENSNTFTEISNSTSLNKIHAGDDTLVLTFVKGNITLEKNNFKFLNNPDMTDTTSNQIVKQFSIDSKLSEFKQTYNPLISMYDESNMQHVNIVSVACAYQFINSYFEDKFCNLIRCGSGDFVLAMKKMLDAHKDFNLVVGETYGAAKYIFENRSPLLIMLPTSDAEQSRAIISTIKKDFSKLPDMEECVKKYSDALAELNKAITKNIGMSNLDAVTKKLDGSRQEMLKVMGSIEKEISRVTRAKILLDAEKASNDNHESIRKFYISMRDTLNKHINIWQEHLRKAQTEDIGLTSHFINIFGLTFNSTTTGQTTEAYQEYCNKKIRNITKEVNKYNALIMSNSSQLSATERGELQAKTLSHDDVMKNLRKELDVKRDIYHNTLEEYSRLKCATGKLSEENQEELSLLLPQLASGIGWVSNTLGTVMGYFKRMKDIDLDDDILCLKSSNYMCSLLQCSAVSHVRTTQSLAYLSSSEFQQTKNSLIHNVKQEEEIATRMGRVQEVDEAKETIYTLIGKREAEVKTIVRQTINLDVEPDI